MQLHVGLLCGNDDFYRFIVFTANIPHREHFIWCENQGARYVTDSSTGRCAVIAPYDAPPAGTSWVTYLFSFKCGGPNRREMSIIYTLEK